MSPPPPDREKKKEDPHGAAANGRCRDDSDLSNPTNIIFILAQEAAFGAEGVPFIDTTDPRHKDDHTLDVNAKVLNAALHARDADRAIRIFSSLSDSDRKEVINKYIAQFGHGDRDSLYVALSGFSMQDRTRILCALETRDAKVCVAGWLQYQMERARSGYAGDADMQIVIVLSLLPRTKIEGAMKAFPRFDHLGRDFLDAVRRESNLDPLVKDAIPILLKGCAELGTRDRLALCTLALDQHGHHFEDMTLQLLAIALSGPSHAAEEARQVMRKDRRMAAFGADARVADLLNAGKLRLKVIADLPDADREWVYEEVVDASQEERDILERGWKLYYGYAVPRPEFKDGNVVDSLEDVRARDLYLETYFALMKFGGLEQLAIWQDELFFPGGSMATALAEAHGDEYAFLQSADRISELDWKELRNPKTREEFRGYIEESMRGYCIEDMQNLAKIMEVLDAKARAATYEDSKKIMSPLELRLGGARNAKEVVRALLQLSVTDVDRVLTEPDGQRILSGALSILKDDPLGQFVVNSLVERMSETRKAARVGDLAFAERLCLEVVQGDVDASMVDAERLMADSIPLDTLYQLGFSKSEIFARLPDVPKSEQDALMRLLSSEELKIAADVLQKRRMTHSNRLFCNVVEGKNIAEVIDSIKKIRRGELTQLEREYAKRFERSLADDVVAAAPRRYQQNYIQAFMPMDGVEDRSNGQSVEIQTGERKPVNIPRDEIERMSHAVLQAISEYVGSGDAEVSALRKLLRSGSNLAGEAVDVAATYGGAMSFAPAVVAMALTGDPENIEPWLTSFASGDAADLVALYTEGVRATTMARFAKVLTKHVEGDLKRGAEEELKTRLPAVFDEIELSARVGEWTLEQTRDALTKRLTAEIADLTITSAEPSKVALKMIETKAMQKQCRFLSSSKLVRAALSADETENENGTFRSHLQPEDYIYIGAAARLPQAAVNRARMKRS